MRALHHSSPQLFFGVDMPQISEAGCEAISQIGNWYFLNNFTYIMIVGITASPNMFPKYVPHKILLKEFAFQIFEIWQTVSLIKRKFKSWPEMPISIAPFHLYNHGHVYKELEDYLDYRWLHALFVGMTRKGS